MLLLSLNILQLMHMIAPSVKLLKVVPKAAKVPFSTNIPEVENKALESEIKLSLI